MIGVFGGTFDPIHFGHLRPALEVCEGLGLDELRFVPSRVPPHRTVPGAQPAQRREMLALAIDGVAGLRVDDRELHRDGPSYTVDTLGSLREELGDVPLCFILGMDAFGGFAEWHRWQAIPDLAHLVVAYRPNVDPPARGPAAELLDARGVADPAALRETSAGYIVLQPVTQLEISATAIRETVAAGRSARYLVPDRVDAYIREQGLYQSSERPGRAGPAERGV